jgi:hypothetical protein
MANEATHDYFHCLQALLPRIGTICLIIIIKLSVYQLPLKHYLIHGLIRKLSKKDHRPLKIWIRYGGAMLTRDR